MILIARPFTGELDFLGQPIVGQVGLFTGPTANNRFGGDFVAGFGQAGQVETLLSFHESGIMLVTARLADNRQVLAVGTSVQTVPEPFVWTGAENSAYNHGPNWEGGAVPGIANAVQLSETTSLIVLDTARSHPGLSLSSGGDHHFILSGETYGIGAEGIAITGGRLRVSNGTLNASGQNTRVGSTGGITSRLVIAEGGAGTTFNTGNLLVGHTGDGEMEIGNATVRVGTVLTLGATPNAKGTLRMDRGGLDVAGGAAIGIPPGSGSRILAENESTILWNSAAVATFDHGSRFEASGLGTLSVGGKFVFRGGSVLDVTNLAEFSTTSGEDALILDGGTALFGTGGGDLGDVHLKNDATMILAKNSIVTAKNLRLADEGKALVAVLESSLTVQGGSVQLAGAPNTQASLTVSDGLIELDVDSVLLGLGKGEAEIFASAGGNLRYSNESLIQAGGGGSECRYTVVDGGTSQGGNFVFVETARLRVEGAGSTFQAATTFLDAVELPRFHRVSADFRKGSESHLGQAELRICNIRISEGAVVKADTLQLDGATIQMEGNGSLLEAAATATVEAPEMFILIDQGTTFKGGTLVMGSQAIVFGTGTLAFGSVTNNGGLISPGFSPGILTIDGSLTQAGGRIVLEIGGREPGVTHDQLVITGAFSFTGGVIELIFTDGFAPQAGQTFELMDIGGASTGVPVVNVRGLEPGWDFEMVRDPETGVLKVHSLSNATALPPVRVASLTVSAATGGGPGKRVTATVTGPPAAEVMLEATNDLLRWSPVGTGAFNGAGQASFEVTDAEATGDRRFYRFTLP